jgi:hypothetical protein
MERLFIKISKSCIGETKKTHLDSAQQGVWRYWGWTLEHRLYLAIGFGFGSTFII